MTESVPLELVFANDARQPQPDAVLAPRVEMPPTVWMGPRGGRFSGHNSPRQVAAMAWVLSREAGDAWRARITKGAKIPTCAGCGRWMLGVVPT